MSGATLEQIEDLFGETIDKVSNMDGMLKTLVEAHSTMARAHSDVGNAFTMMAKTFEKVEERQTQLEHTNIQLYKDKGIPPKTFFVVTSTLCIVIVLGAVWVTNTFIKASFTSIEAGRREDFQKLQKSISTTKQEILEEVKDGEEK